MNEKVAKEKMIGAIRKDFETRFKYLVEKGEMELFIAYTQDKAKGLEFAEQVKNEFPNVKLTFIDPLSLSVSCHIGPGAIAVACARVYKANN